MKKRIKAAGIGGNSALLFYLAADAFNSGNNTAGIAFIIAGIAINLVILIYRPKQCPE